MDKAIEYRNNQIGNLCKALTGLVWVVIFGLVCWGMVYTAVAVAMVEATQ